LNCSTTRRASSFGPDDAATGQIRNRAHASNNFLIVVIPLRELPTATTHYITRTWEQTGVMFAWPEAADPRCPPYGHFRSGRQNRRNRAFCTGGSFWAFSRGPVLAGATGARPGQNNAWARLGPAFCWPIGGRSHLMVTPAQFVSAMVPWSARLFCQQTRSPTSSCLDCSPVISTTDVKR
jgi:hypothetical protein